METDCPGPPCKSLVQLRLNQWAYFPLSNGGGLFSAGNCTWVTRKVQPHVKEFLEEQRASFLGEGMMLRSLGTEEVSIHRMEWLWLVWKTNRKGEQEEGQVTCNEAVKECMHECGLTKALSEREKGSQGIAREEKLFLSLPVSDRVIADRRFSCQFCFTDIVHLPFPPIHYLGAVVRPTTQTLAPVTLAVRCQAVRPSASQNQRSPDIFQALSKRSITSWNLWEWERVVSDS